MRLKSYLKGLGLGIFITALILSLTLDNAKGDISDEEIKERAAKLGMVSENSMLLAQAKDMADNARENAMASVSEEAVSGTRTEKEQPEGTVSAGAVSDNGEIIQPKTESGIVSSDAAKPSEEEDAAGTAGTGMTKDTTLQNTSKSEETLKDEDGSVGGANTDKATNDPGEIVVIDVNSGESSISVATKMAEAGLVNDAHQFDSYLVLSGYDRKLVVGSHPIPKGSSAAEMGALLTSRQ